MDWQREMCGEVCRMGDRIAVVDDAGGWDVFDLGMNRLGGGQEADIEAAKSKCESWQKRAQVGDYDWVDITNSGGPDGVAKGTARDELPVFVECAEAGNGIVCLYEYSNGLWGWMFEDDSYGGDSVPTVSSSGFYSKENALADFELVREHGEEELHFPNYSPHWGGKNAWVHRGHRHVRRCGKRASYGDYAWEDVTNFDNAWLANGVARNGKVPVFVECAEAGNGIVCLCEYDDGLWYWVFEDDSLAGDSAYVSTGPFMSRDNALSDFEFVREHSQEELHFDGYEPHWGSKNASSFDDDVYENPAKFPNFQESPAGGAISWMSELASGQVLEVWSSDDHHGWVLYDDNGSVLRENMFDGAEYDVDVLIDNMCDDFFGTDNTSIAKRSQNFANSPRVPEEVDSKDDQPCPLCGSDHYDGKHCQTCGYDQSPDGLDDIDIDDLDKIEDVDQTTDDESADASDGVETKDDGEDSEDGASMSKASGWWDDDPRKVMYEDDIVVLHGPDGSVWYKGIYDYSPMHDDDDYDSGFTFNRDNGRYEHSDGSWYEKVGERRCKAEEGDEQQVSAMAKSADIETWWTPGARDRVSITTFDDGEISIDTNQPYVWGDYASAYHRRSMGDNEFDIRIDTDSAISPSKRHIKMMTSLVGPPHYDDIVEELLRMNESLRDTRSIDRT